MAGLMNFNCASWILICGILIQLTFGVATSGRVKREVRLDQSGRCVLPPVESEPYRILDCDGNTTSACTNPGGSLVDSNTAIQLTCQDGRTKLSHCVNGIWVPPPTCYKCGKTFEHSVAVDGDGLRREALPWHVALYKNNSGKFSPICGGGLITPNSVLTNAICVYQESTKKLYDLSEFKMAVGKFNWTWESHEASEQRRNSLRGKMASKRRKMFQKNKTQETTENGSLRNYDDSLAVATVETPFALSSFTLPVCLDWTPWVHVKTGKVITYKVTAPDSSSSSIVFENQSYDLDLVDYDECIDNVPRDFVKFVGSSRLCATRPDGVDVISQGSIGNAFTVVKEGRHVFYGMVVLKPRDVGVNILLMENVSMYRQFIADNVPDISRMHETQVILNVEW